MFISDTPTNITWSSFDTDDHSSRESSILLVNGLFAGLVVLVVFLRGFTKLFMAMRLFVDDFLIIGSTLCFTAFCMLNIYAVSLGFGKHIWDLPGITTNSTSDELSKAAAPVQEINYIAFVILSPAIILAKLSVIMVLLRVFPSTMRALRYALLGLCAIIIGCCVTQALLIIFQCAPVESSWDIQSGSCYIEPLDLVLIGLGGLNAVTDFIICLTPIPYFLQLGITKPAKLCLCALFMSGLIACAISVARLLSLRGLSTNIDFSYATAPYTMWSCAEVGLIIIAGSVPSLRPLLATILPEFFREHNFSCIFNSEKRLTSSGNYHGSHSNPPKTLGSEQSWSPGASLSGSACGTITITKEYQIEEMEKEDRAASTSPPGTPLAQKLGPRAVVKCERVDSVHP